MLCSQNGCWGGNRKSGTEARIGWFAEKCQILWLREGKRSEGKAACVVFGAGERERRWEFGTGK